MDTRRLHAFVKIVDIGSLTRAAAILHIAQPALSQQIVALETHFGKQLLVRSKRGVIPTDAGRALYRHAQVMLRQLEQAETDIESAGTRIAGHVSVGLAPLSTAATLALPLLKEVRERYPGIVRILTKSPLVVRDIDLLTRLPRVDVGMTVTTTDDRVSRWLEVRAPRSSHRLKALAALQEAGIPTFAFVGPLLPHFAERPDLLDQLFGRLVDVGVREVYIEHINLKQYIRERMNLVLVEEEPEVREAYARARAKSHREKLDEIVAGLLVKHGLRLRFDEVIYHDEFQAKHGK